MKINFLIIALFIINACYSQIGKDCANPLIINSLPFSASGTTNGFGMDYQVGPNGTTYMSGNDFVLRFQPSVNMKISIALTGTNSLCGLFLANNCPDVPGVNYLAYVEASSGNPAMSNIQVYSDTVYYIIIDTYNAFSLFPSTTFNINVIKAFDVDLAGGKVYDPITSCELSNYQRFVFRFSNIGVDTVFNPQIGFQVNNDAPIIETDFDTIVPGVTYLYTYNTHYDLSQLNTVYNIKMFTSCSNDVNSSNDTIFFPVVNNETVSTFPYFQDFETDSKGWSTAWLSHIMPGTSWKYENPNKPIINHAASGNKCWVTDSAGTCIANESSYVIGPCFDFSTLTLPVIDLDIWFETDVPDMVTIEYTTEKNADLHWHQLGNTGDGNNWYNTPVGYSAAGWNGSSGGWLHARHALDTLGGKPYVQFRITYLGGNNNVKEGFAFDNIKISESPLNDLSLDEIVYPIGSCKLAAIDSVVVKITNHGMNAVHGFDVKCSIDGGADFITETIQDTLNFLDTMTYKFSSNFDFSVLGLYNVIAITSLTAEQNTSNDTAKVEVMHYSSVSTYPYFEDFETSDGTWFASGINSSWQWGVPNDSVLTTAASGSKIWATNLSGYHNFSEHSVVTSPCFDLSTMTEPKIKMKIWYDETNPTYCQLKISTNGGLIYNTLGSASDSNWYNAGYSWTYSSNGWKQVEHTLHNYVGNSDIRLQFVFEGAVEKTGFAFDSIVICDMPKASFNEVSTKGWQVIFNNSSNLFDSCLWNFGDGSYSNVLNPTHLYSSADSVLVTLTVYNSCGVDSVKKYVHPKYVGIVENDLSNFIKLYPNPVKDELNINFSDDFGNCVIEINNIQGEIVMRNVFTANKSYTYKISTNKLLNGLYFVKIKCTNGILNRKFIKTD